MKTETKKIKIPVTREYAEISLLVETKEREGTSTCYYNDDGSPMLISAMDINTYPHKELSRIIDNGKYKLELVQGFQTTNKSLLIVREE